MLLLCIKLFNFLKIKTIIIIIIDVQVQIVCLSK